MKTLFVFTVFVVILSNLNNTLCALIFPPFFEEAEDTYFGGPGKYFLRHKRNKASDVSSKPACSEDKLMQFLAEIQVITPESILKIATGEALTHMCRQISENMDKTERYLDSCTPPNQADLYTQLIKGVAALHQKLCVNEKFRKEFDTYHKCLKEMSSELESCNGPADWNEDSEPSKICTAYKDIADCYYIKAAKVCGKQAAATIKELMVAIINSIITVKCNVKATPEVKDPMPSAYIEKNKKVPHPHQTNSAFPVAAAYHLLYLVLANYIFHNYITFK